MKIFSLVFKRSIGSIKNYKIKKVFSNFKKVISKINGSDVLDNDIIGFIDINPEKVIKDNKNMI